MAAQASLAGVAATGALATPAEAAGGPDSVADGLSDADLAAALAEMGILPKRIASKDIDSGWSLFASTPQAMREIDSKGKCWILIFDLSSIRKLITTLDDLNGRSDDTTGE